MFTTYLTGHAQAAREGKVHTAQTPEPDTTPGERRLFWPKTPLRKTRGGQGRQEDRTQSVQHGEAMFKAGSPWTCPQVKGLRNQVQATPVLPQRWRRHTGGRALEKGCQIPTRICRTPWKLLLSKICLHTQVTLSFNVRGPQIP